MEACVIVTYRCNARCQMCHTWKYPSRQEDEISPEIMDRLPGGHERLNITGGEPLLRNDIEEIISVLDKKTKRLEISTNGFFTDRILKIAEKFPHITIRISVEGLPKRNDELRGIKDGFDHALRTLINLKEMGVKDIGFGIVISDKNAYDLLDVYHLVSSMDVEFGNATMHNSFYFHKHDNRIEDVKLVSEQMKRFIKALLQSKRSNVRLRIKDWFRAYINLGILQYIQKKSRPLPCGAGTDTIFLDPFGLVLACNGSDEPWVMGNLKETTFDSIWHSEQAGHVRELVKNCNRNCWMTGTAVPAMRRSPWQPAWWVLKNKIRLVLGQNIVL